MTDVTPGLRAMNAAYQALSEDEKTLLELAVEELEEYIGDEIAVGTQVLAATLVSARLAMKGLRIQLVPIDSRIR